MTEPEYGIIEPKSTFAPIALRVGIPHKGGVLNVGYPAFGPDTYKGNLAKMSRHYFHSKELPDVTFGPLTTPKSISAIAFNFSNEGKLKILDPSWLQIGRILKTPEGVYANLPNDEKGNPIRDLDTLKKLLDKTNKIEVRKGKIYLGENDFAYAEEGTFEQGNQSGDDFARGGLARILEHTTDEVARNLLDIASRENYPKGVNVWGFEPSREPILRVVDLYSDRDSDSVRLYIHGNDWDDNDGGGYAFGGLVSGGTA